MTHTTYTAVIVTRNRPEALTLSLPLLLNQSRLPEKVLVIDSSDENPALANAALVAHLGNETSVLVQHQNAPPGMTIQRNIGLAQVESDVTFFPDDDSLVHPGALEAMMRIYDLDTEGQVGGVCSAEAKVPPPGVLEGRKTYEMTGADRVKARISRTRFAIEERLCREPFHLVAERKYARQPSAPAWLSDENAIIVPWMTGFRMSFRTKSIRNRGFCEELGRYALFEDTDMGFSVLDGQLLVGARNAQIYHHKAPMRRANGRALGAMQILNRAYVIARSGETDRDVLAALRRFSFYKMAQYAAALPSGGEFARDRLAGAHAAWKGVPTLLAALPEDRVATYLTLRSSCFVSEN